MDELVRLLYRAARLAVSLTNQAILTYSVRVPDILHATHAKPWADSESDNECLDVLIGFLLCANHDALFDRGLITFTSGKNISATIKIVV